jgi:urea carboxylase
MDDLAFRLGNRLLDNDAGEAGIEITAAGPRLQFLCDVDFCLTGAPIDAKLDGHPIDSYAVVKARAGSILAMGRTAAVGMRAYLLVRGGFDVPRYLGSRATFSLGAMGGLAGRCLSSGDLLTLAQPKTGLSRTLEPPPRLSTHWTLRVLAGPHGAPDFFTPEDIQHVLDARWQVHLNSSRTGVRLIGPKPSWARRDGGEAGLHPSNIHDNAYVVGAVDFTGDMPIILGPDGPSLGGFVCPFVVVDADLWKLGQLAPGHTLSFQCIDPDEAAGLRRAQQAGIAALDPALLAVAQNVTTSNDLGKRDPVLATTPADAQRPAAVYRRQGERNVLVEYGPIVLDLALRFRVHALMLRLQAMSLPGLLDLTPGIRSLQIQFDPDVLSQDKVLALLQETDACLGNLDEVEVPTRTVYLPLSWNDPAVAQTIARYGATVRNDAPWCPDNIEFIRRINGLDSADAVRRLIFDAAYLVMGLGDVYLGAPVATPLDPRHRLVTTKYNPARTWTPPNVVGIGGAYLCIYGMEGPGGYQLFGRTIQVWNSFARNTDFRDGKPWLLRFFDQIRFFPVSDAELVAWRRDFPFGRRHVRIEEGRFRWREYRAFLDAHRDDIARFEQARRTSFDAERLQWERLGEFNRAATEGEASQVTAETALAVDIPPGCELIEAPLNGIVWQVAVEPGAHVKAGEAVAMVEAMKMQCDVRSHCDGVIRAVYAKPSQAITAGAAILAIAPDAP